MRTPKLLLVAASLFALLGSTATADVFMRQIDHTGEIKMMGHSQPARTDTSTVWLAKDKATMINSEGQVIFRADRDTLYIVNNADKTYQAIALATIREMAASTQTMGEEMAKAMEGVSDEDKAKMKEVMEQLGDNPQMKAMAEKMMGNATAGENEPGGSDAPFMKVTVTPTDETKTINGWETRKYNGTMEMAMGSGTSEVWAAPSLKIDAEMYNTLQVGLMAGGKGFEEVVKEMSKIEGVPVYSLHKTKMMGADVETTSELIEFKDNAKAPAGTFDIPEGYKQVDVPMMGGMGR